MPKPRFDFLIIYGHGLEHLRSIMSIIRDDSNFDILYIKKFSIFETIQSKYPQLSKISDYFEPHRVKEILINKFIFDIYGCDVVPIQHLIGKTRYLIDTTPEFAFILLKNKEPDEKIFGEGEFAHIQCAKIKALKEEIRDAYNPKNEDESRTEHHVVHGADYEFQTAYILQYLGLPDFKYFNRKPNPELNVEFHVEPFEIFRIAEVDINKVLCRTSNNEFVPVKDSICYKYITGNKKAYESHIESVIGIKDFSDHYPEKFDKLISSFYYNNDNLIVVEQDGDVFKMNDGNHRSAILYHKGIKKLKAIVINPQYSNRIDFSWFFNHIPVRYTVLRKKEWFPAYYIGEDLDILTDDPDGLVNHVCQLSKHYDINIRLHRHEGHTHMDIYFGDEFDFRIDIIDVLKYNKFNLDSAYSNVLLSRSEGIFIRNNLKVVLPSETDELVTRYFEYVEHPNKIRHLNYVKEKAGDNIDALIDTVKAHTDLEITKETIYDNKIH